MSKSFFFLTLLTTLTSCSTVLSNLPGVYSLEIQQGNIIDQTMVNQLRPNMSKRQVLYIMGSPMLVDVFHQKRWDYIYSDKGADEDKAQKRISLFFENDQLSAIQGDIKPGTVPLVKPVETTVDVPKRDLEKTLWEKLTGLVGYDNDDTPRKNSSTPQPAATDDSQ